MVGLAIEIAAFLFLMWVAFMLLATVVGVGGAVLEGVRSILERVEKRATAALDSLAGRFSNKVLVILALLFYVIAFGVMVLIQKVTPK